MIIERTMQSIWNQWVYCSNAPLIEFLNKSRNGDAESDINLSPSTRYSIKSSVRVCESMPLHIRQLSGVLKMGSLLHINQHVRHQKMPTSPLFMSSCINICIICGSLDGSTLSELLSVPLRNGSINYLIMTSGYTMLHILFYNLYKEEWCRILIVNISPLRLSKIAIWSIPEPTRWQPKSDWAYQCQFLPQQPHHGRLLSLCSTSFCRIVSYIIDWPRKRESCIRQPGAQQT